MDHIYFIFYLLSLLSGALLLTHVAIRYKNAVGFAETFSIYSVLTAFVLLGASALYVSVNVLASPLIVNGFVSGALCIVGSLIYLQPRQIMVTLGLGFKGPMHWLFLSLAVIGPLAGLLVWFVPSDFFVAVLSVPLLAYFVVTVYGQLLSWRNRHTRSRSKAFALVSALLPILSIIVACTEGLVYGDWVVQRGVTLSLPLIYLAANISVWVFREQVFRLPNTAELSTALPRVEGGMALQQSNLDRLTPKEQEIVLALRNGLSNKQIAAELHMAPSTVKNHLYRIFKKLGVNNRVALVNELSNTQFT